MNPAGNYQPDWRAAFLAAVDRLPDRVEIPFERTPEGERQKAFLAMCPEEFRGRIDRRLLKSPLSFDRVANWTGTFPGPLAFGVTGGAKTRAAWSAFGRLYVRENKPFAWFPVRRLMTEIERHESLNITEDFFRNYSHYSALFVDDLDKINWAFESQTAALFAFYDWVYRTKKPCITTTNQTREWWEERMGEAFARRLFDGAHVPVSFDSASRVHALSA